MFSFFLALLLVGGEEGGGGGREGGRGHSMYSVLNRHLSFNVAAAASQYTELYHCCF